MQRLFFYFILLYLNSAFSMQNEEIENELKEERLRKSISIKISDIFNKDSANFLSEKIISKIRKIKKYKKFPYRATYFWIDIHDDNIEFEIISGYQIGEGSYKKAFPTVVLHINTQSLELKNIENSVLLWCQKKKV